MPTIAEIIAAKKAATKTGGVSPPVTTAPKESIAERIEVKEAIDRIDPPGKSERAAAARKSAGIILNQSLPEERPDMTPPPDTEPRALGARVGQALTVLPDHATPEVVAWDEVLHAVATDLVIMSDPNPESDHVWLAIAPIGKGLRPILIHQLPFRTHPERKLPPGDPF